MLLVFPSMNAFIECAADSLSSSAFAKSHVVSWWKITLMHWYFLAKQDGRGYCKWLKCRWIFRIHMIASISVNALRMSSCSSANCIIMCYLPTYSYIYVWSVELCHVSICTDQLVLTDKDSWVSNPLVLAGWRSSVDSLVFENNEKCFDRQFYFFICDYKKWWCYNYDFY